MLVEGDATSRIIGAAMCVHRALGPGLLESAYETCLSHELTKRGCLVERQRPIPLMYDGVMIRCAYRVDLIVDQLVIVEVKSVASLSSLHESQLMTYLRLTRKSVGLLINFNVTQLKNGIIRRVL